MDLVHIGLCGSTRMRNIQGEKYFMFFIDDDYRISWIIFLREKSEALENLKIFKVRVENKVDRKIKCLRSDRGGEISSDEFNNFYENHGIRRKLSAPRTPHQNGVVKRTNQTIQEAIETMIKGVELLKFYWRESIHTTIYTLNIILY